MGNKFGEADDAAYVDKLVGKVLVQACAAVTLARPMDPVEFLSEWLHKHCDNACILKDNAREKARKFNKENEREYELNRKANADALWRTEQQACVNHMKTITDDPYLLWDTCLKSVCAFTAYVAVVINKIWEPKPEKKKAEGEEEGEEGEEEEEPAQEEDEEGEEGEDKVLGSDDSSVDNDEDVEEKDEPEEDAEGEEEGEQEADPEEEEEEGEEGKDKKPKGESTEDAAPKPPKPPKAPKPLNYKRKKLLYVAATRPANTHMLNRQLDIKKGPVTFAVLLEGLPELHIPNVISDSNDKASHVSGLLIGSNTGVHFFGGIPRVGAYFVVPITVEFTAKKYLKEEFKDRPPEWFAQVRQKQVIALLCVDTLKTEHVGTGKAFEPIETEFMAACGAAVSTALDMNNKEISKDQNAGTVMEKYKEKLKEIKVARKAQLDQEKADAIAAKKAKEKEGRRKQFEEAHKAWTERQTAKAEAKKKKDEEMKAKKKAGEEIEEEEAEEEEEDPEPVPEEEPPEEEADEEEASADEAGEEAGEGDEDGEVEEKPVDPGIDDAELEPNPLEGIEKLKGEGEGEGEEEEEEEEEAGEPEEEELEEEEPKEEEEPEPPEEEEGAVESGEAGATEEGAEKAVELEDVRKLKEKKAENAKKAKETKKQIKDLKKLLKGFDKVKMKTTLDLEKVGKEAEKYEKALQIADGVVKYLKLLLGNVYSLLVENKDAEVKRIKRWPYPNRHVHRVLKIHNLNVQVLKEYDPLKAPDPVMWKSADSYLAGIKEAKLAEQAPIGFLLQQWMLACKKVTAAGVTYHKIKAKFTEISKEFAENELAKIICEVETQLATEKLTKMVADEEIRLAKAKAAEETEEKRLADIAAAELAAKEAADAAAAAAAEAAAEAAAAAGEEAPAEET
ncbi:hypothetical protein CY35_08G092500 [Sphagnum magellanicum]|nr:hypothetical protein CY35_08G092500 [Sphagnum magellanicum]